MVGGVLEAEGDNSVDGEGVVPSDFMQILEKLEPPPHLPLLPLDQPHCFANEETEA